MNKLFAFGAVALVTAFLGGTAGYIFWNQNAGDDVFAQCRSGQVGGASIGGPFSLLNAKGEIVTEKTVMEKPSLVYFGYTFCPDVCPFDMSRNSEVIDLLAAEGKDVNLVFITVDPARDTPQVVGEFTSNLDERVIGLTGSESQIKAAADAYRVYYRAQAAEDDYYLVDHSAFTYLMLPGIGFADFYKREASAAEMAAGAACMIDAAG